SQPARRKRAASAAGAASPDFITALARGLDVLRCFRPGVRALGNLDLARLTGLPKPTISRITYTLTELGYLRYHADTGKYAMHGSPALSLRLPVGYRASLDTAMGRAYLAALPEAARQALLGRLGQAA
ncbi:helix-turn-helix domain-containing protein, partial [Bordetella pertussis]|uniref:helix-turn-helix domain-containing protein n=1 Tax=Bordetella pertussis TaxID=520 RepID=UPI000AC722F3